MKERLNELLFLIKQAKTHLTSVETGYNHRITAINEEFSMMAVPIRLKITAYEKELNGVCMSVRADLFPKPGTVLKLSYGSVVYQAALRVIRKRGVLETLKKIGMISLIKIAESVDWDRVDKLDDKALTAIGTSREIKESFSYDLK